MDRQWLCTHKLRYDLTVIASFYHQRNPAVIKYQEVFEVFEGEAKYLFQSRRLDAVMISAHSWDIVIIPRNMVNSSSTLLLIANFATFTWLRLILGINPIRQIEFTNDLAVSNCHIF
jgi:hypothetical protein